MPTSGGLLLPPERATQQEGLGQGLQREPVTPASRPTPASTSRPSGPPGPSSAPSAVDPALLPPQPGPAVPSHQLPPLPLPLSPQTHPTSDFTMWVQRHKRTFPCRGMPSNQVGLQLPITTRV